MDLWFEYRDNGTAHDDMVLTFAGQTWTCDSYYFALDSILMPDREDPAKVGAVLRALFSQWISAVEALQVRDLAYLPYDFSDEYTGWLRCVGRGDVVEIAHGYAEIAGYSFFPSAVGEYLGQVDSFTVRGPTQSATFNELLAGIRESMRVA